MNQQLILHLIKSCEKYELTEKESLETISKILGKGISRRTYYYHKKKLYDKEIIHQLKDSIYDSHMMRCLLLELEDDDRVQSLKAEMLVWEQLPNRKDIFHDTEKRNKHVQNTILRYVCVYVYLSSFRNTSKALSYLYTIVISS